MQDLRLAGTASPEATGPTRPDFPDLLERVRALAPHFAERAAATEAAGRVPAESLAELREAELLGLVRPARFGGFEYGPAEHARVAFEIGRACGSTGWCASLAIYFPLMLSYFPLEAQEAVYASENDLMAVSYLPSADCDVIEGGYSIAGTWPYVSGCDNAGWFMVSVLVPAPDGNRVPHWMLAPAAEFDIDHDSWRVAGLQGTGSKAVTAKQRITVPAERAIRLPDVLTGATPGAAIEGNVLARFIYPTFGPTCLVAPVIGMAQGALDAFVEAGVTRVRTTRPGQMSPVAQSPQIQSRIGQASADIDAAFALLVAGLDAAEAKVFAGEVLTTRERVAIRRNQGYAGARAAAVVNELFGHNGTAGAQSGGALQRFWRDANAGALHSTLDWDGISAMAGRHDLGLEPAGLY